MKVGKCSGESDQSLMNIYLGISCALLNYVLSTRFILSKPRWNARGRSASRSIESINRLVKLERRRNDN